MKFSEIIEPEGGFVNNTSSYFLVLGIGTIDVPSYSSTGTYYSQNGILIDNNGQTVDRFFECIIIVTSFNSNMTVWNGTSMETEPYTQYVTQAVTYKKSKMFIPPGYKMIDFAYAIGFWMTFEEVERYFLKEDREFEGDENDD